MSQALSAAERRYLKALFRLEYRTGGSSVSSGMIARHLGVTDPSASVMLQRLANQQLVDYKRYHASRLTTQGRACAREVIRIHRLLETWLYGVLALPWHRVHREAETLEPTVSDRFLQRVSDRLRLETHCPYGRPLTVQDVGDSSMSLGTSLRDLPSGSTSRILEIDDLDATILRRLDLLDLRPRRTLTIVHRDAHQVVVTVEGSGILKFLNDEEAAAVYTAPVG